MEGETERVDSVRLAKRGYSLVWGEEEVMQDDGVCLERRMGTTLQSTPFIEKIDIIVNIIHTLQ